MRQWFIGFNDYWYTACIWLDETPWYLVAAESVVTHLCSALHHIPVPKKWSEDYGSLGGLFHCYVCMPCTLFVHDKTKTTRIPLPFFFLEEQFPEEKVEDVWEDEYDEQRKKNEKSAKRLDKGYRSAYNKVLAHECLINKGREKDK